MRQFTQRNLQNSQIAWNMIDRVFRLCHVADEHSRADVSPRPVAHGCVSTPLGPRHKLFTHTHLRVCLYATICARMA